MCQRLLNQTFCSWSRCVSSPAREYLSQRPRVISMEHFDDVNTVHILHYKWDREKQVSKIYQSKDRTLSFMHYLSTQSMTESTILTNLDEIQILEYELKGIVLAVSGKIPWCACWGNLLTGMYSTPAARQTSTKLVDGNNILLRRMKRTLLASGIARKKKEELFSLSDLDNISTKLFGKDSIATYPNHLLEGKNASPHAAHSRKKEKKEGSSERMVNSTSVRGPFPAMDPSCEEEQRKNIG